MTNFVRLKNHLSLAVLTGLACAAVIVAVIQSQGYAQDTKQDTVVLIGLDAMKKSVTSTIPAATYRKNLSIAFGSVHDSILPVLSENKNIKKAGPSFHLNAIGVGVGLAGQFGLGPIINVTPSAQIRLVFTNSLNPVYPN